MALLYFSYTNLAVTRSFYIRADALVCQFRSAILAILFAFPLLGLVPQCGFAQDDFDRGMVNIYGVNSETVIGQVARTAKYRVIASRGDKKLIQFTERAVPGWVSADFVVVDEARNQAVVRVDGLNFRSSPSLSAGIITQVNEGFASSIVDRKNSFVKLLAPLSLKVLIDDSGGQFERKWRRGNAARESSPRLAIDRLDRGVIADASGDDVTLATRDRSTDVGVKAESGALKSVPSTDEVSQALRQESSQASDSDEVVDLESSDIESDLEQTHLLAPGDSISLLVFGEKDLSVQNVRVPQNGKVSFPLIGPVTVLGKTTSEVETDIAKLLSKGYVRNPRLTVSIFSYRPIFIRGEVASSGSFPYVAGLTVAKALALAGGVKASAANINGVSITRDGRIVAQNLSNDSQVAVASGDIVSVEPDLDVVQAESSYVFLHGEIEQAGAYEFKKGLTVEKAVVLAGGFTQRASKNKISISRYEDAGENGEPASMTRVKLYEPVRPGDVIKVGASWF